MYEKSGTEQAPLAPFYTDNRDKFTVLYDRTHMVSRNAGNIQMPYLNISKKISRPTIFQGGATVAESGQIYLVMTSDSTIATDKGPRVRWESRILYKD